MRHYMHHVSLEILLHFLIQIFVTKGTVMVVFGNGNTFKVFTQNICLFFKAGRSNSIPKQKGNPISTALPSIFRIWFHMSMLDVKLFTDETYFFQLPDWTCHCTKHAFTLTLLKEFKLVAAG